MTSPETPKKRNTKSWKTLAHQNQQDANYWREEVARSEKEVAGLNSILADARSVSKMWQDTHAFMRRIATVAISVGVVEFFVILRLAFR